MSKDIPLYAMYLALGLAIAAITYTITAYGKSSGFNEACMTLGGNSIRTADGRLLCVKLEEIKPTMPSYITHLY